MARNLDSKNRMRCVMILGCFLVNFPLGIVYYYGNLSTYVDSFLLYRVEPRAFDVQPDWLLSVFTIMYVVGVMAVDWLTTKFRAWSLELACIAVFNVGTYATYWSAQHSTAMILVTFMVLTGYTAGFLNMITLVHVRRVMTKHVGLASAVVSSAFSAGSIVNNYVITAYVNPHNLTPDVRQSKKAFFSQASVLDNVPMVFVITALISSAVHFLGYVLEQVPLSLYDLEVAEETLLTPNDQRRVAESEGINTPYDSASRRVTTVSEEHQSSEIGQESAASLKPSDILRERSLYLLWLATAALTYGVLFTQNFFKQYGQLWIEDDNFLTSVGSCIAFSNGVCRILVGFSLDKIGVKRTLILVMSLNSALFMFWFLAAMLNRWLYFACSQVLTGVQGTLFVIFAVAALKLYGPAHYASNYGLIMMATAAPNLVLPILYDYLREEFGWLSIVLVGSVFSTAVLLLVLCFMREDRGR